MVYNKENFFSFAERGREGTDIVNENFVRSLLKFSPCYFIIIHFVNEENVISFMNEKLINKK